ncbi:long-chain fatty acid--CoA ligase [Streptomyces sp. NWU339]|uniref:class I adenylate-forming enzyme family protein n=1 Tax=Streptomyces sp. NWU339 TaxID=2185284 RepID=UPI000D6722EC|nr:AMP-binding protein [Streptomyces sp. NWU339]PWI07184.1 long-chain fatty acid--CoA ligase [Streptomyces sp. NWU339]
MTDEWGDRYTSAEVLALYREHDDTLIDLVAGRAAADPDRPMLVCGERSWTWAQAADATGRLAGHLRNRGVEAGDRVLVMGRNSDWHVLALLAAAGLGAVFVPVNPDFKAEEAAYVLRQSGARAILCDEAAEPVAEAARDDVDSSAWIQRLDGGLLDAEPIELGGGDRQAPCVMIYTSGTTGFPKGVLHSQQSVIAAGESFVERVRLQPHDRVLTILPLFHVNGLLYSVAGALAAGATLLLEPRFSASRFWPTVKRLGATQVNMIEAISAILLNRPGDEYVPGHGLRKVYGIRQASTRAFRERFEVPHLVGGYGMTEIPGILSTPYDAEARPGSMGRLCRHPDPARPWAQCRIVDEAGADVPDGEVGELWVRTPIVMLEYFREPEQTADAFEGDWFRTGDLVRRDEDGWYYFVARKKDIIRRRGENVSGAELDRVVAEHPEVVLAAAVGVPSEMGDEDILLVATPRADSLLTEQEVADFCGARLARIKRPRYVLLTQDMPLTPTGKVAKHLLRADATLRDRAREVDVSADQQPARPGPR